MIVTQSEILSCQLALEAEMSQGKTRTDLSNGTTPFLSASEPDLKLFEGGESSRLCWDWCLANITCLDLFWIRPGALS